MKNNLSRFIFGTIFFGMIILTAAPVFACSPSKAAIDLTLEDRVHNAPMILVGTVLKGFTSSYGNGYEVVREVEVEVERYFRGEGPTIVRIDGFGDGADCLSAAPAIGQEAVFFVEGNPDGTLDAVYLGVHDATANPHSETMSIIESITGEGVAPYPLPLTSQISRMVMQYWMWLLVLLFLIVDSIVTYVFLKRYFDKRKSKAKRS